MHLKAIKDSHLPFIMSWINDKESLYYFANLKKEITEKEELEYLHKMMHSKNDFLYSMFNDNNEYIGQCSINQIYWPALNGRLFIYIKREYRLKGYGKDCINTLLDVAFNNLKLHKVWLIIRNNNKSIEGYKQLGFKVEGNLIQEYKVNNRYYDMTRLYILNPNNNPIPKKNERI